MSHLSKLKIVAQAAKRQQEGEREFGPVEGLGGKVRYSFFDLGGVHLYQQFRLVGLSLSIPIPWECVRGEKARALLRALFPPPIGLRCQLLSLPRFDRADLAGQIASIL